MNLGSLYSCVVSLIIYISMQGIRQAPSKLYWFISGIIEMLLLFFLSIFKLNKPSDTLTRDDINHIRRGNTPRNNGNDYQYRGSRGNYYFSQDRPEYTWEDEEEEDDSLKRRGATICMIAFWKARERPQCRKIKALSFDPITFSLKTIILSSNTSNKSYN